MRPTIVLVHGAFAESASWDLVIDSLRGAGHDVIAVANPLRSLARDAAAVGDAVRTIEGPVVLAAHSYGGAVISNVDAAAGDIAASSRPSSSASWPSGRARAGSSGSPAPRTRRRCRTRTRRRT